VTNWVTIPAAARTRCRTLTDRPGRAAATWHTTVGPGLGFETKRLHGTVVPHACHVVVSLGLNHGDSRGIEPTRDLDIRRFQRLPIMEGAVPRPAPPHRKIMKSGWIFKLLTSERRGS
jgi:hypothetical protein